MVFRGSCHCGKIAFDVEGEIKEAMACNCSICQRKGSLMWFVPRDKLTLLKGNGDMSTYTFNKHVIQHHFCPTCGIHPFGEGKDAKGNSMAAVNINCLENLDVASVKVQHYDGRGS